MRIEALLATYPRARPGLPDAYRDSYVDHYRSNRSGKSGLSRIVMKLESWMHRRVADGVHGAAVLELGAGNLNHVPYHPASVRYDVVEPFRELFEGSPDRSRVGEIYGDLTEVPADRRYDCILSVAVLEHLTALPAVLAGAGLRLKERGTFRAGFPSEGGALWGLAWRLTTGIEYRLKRGLDYGVIMRHEHVNTAGEILALLRFLYGRLEIRRFPLPFHHCSFYTVAIAAEPRLDRCLSLCPQAPGAPARL